MYYDPREVAEYERQLAKLPTTDIRKPIAKLFFVASVFIAVPLGLYSFTHGDKDVGAWLAVCGLFIAAQTYGDMTAPRRPLKRPRLAIFEPLFYLLGVLLICGMLWFLVSMLGGTGFSFFIGACLAYGIIRAFWEWLTAVVPAPTPPRPMPYGNARYATPQELVDQGLISGGRQQKPKPKRRMLKLIALAAIGWGLLHAMQ